MMFKFTAQRSQRFARTRSSWLLLLLPALLFSRTILAQAQTNSGTEFYVAFGANEGADEVHNLLALYLTGMAPTSGIVEIPALGFSQHFTTTPGAITTVVLPSDTVTGTVELRQSETVYPGLGVHVTSDNPIAVFGINHKLYSTDAFMALPVSALGMSYRTMNYRSSNIGAVATAGEFWMVASENNTRVILLPNARTANGSPAGIPIEVILNRGDSYLLQGDAQDGYNDLTGTSVTSNKPIALFSGHERTQIPFDALNSQGSTSRNHLCEQIPPESAWGDSVIVIPFATSVMPDLVRVVSSSLNNTIRLNDSVVAVIDSGQFYEIRALSGPTVVSATSRILVGQYMHTSWGSQIDRQHPGYGDPALTLVLPVEQYDKNYTVISIADTAFTANFLNIVVEGNETIPNLYLDGTRIPQADFKKISSTFFNYAQIPVAQGTHTISCNRPFGVTVYALGNVDAYAYTGGSLEQPLGVQPKAAEAPPTSTLLKNLEISSNPFATHTTISYELRKTTSVRFELLDEIGRVVQLEVHGRLSKGTHLISIVAASLPPGSYFGRFITGDGRIYSVKLRKI